MVWDEVPLIGCSVFDTMNRSFRDSIRAKQPALVCVSFGGYLLEVLLSVILIRID
ncbi:hypothetical protein BDF14DRAFT_1760664 [Spinellus fusiger]|nr:hypothetical protein BDF14DRAFT_1760664 [Spinellus fusiger]